MIDSKIEISTNDVKKKAFKEHDAIKSLVKKMFRIG